MVLGLHCSVTLPSGLGPQLRFHPLLLAPRALGEAKLINSVGKALCGSMLTNSGSLELAHVGKRVVKTAWTRLRDGTWHSGWPVMSSGWDLGRALLSFLFCACCHFSQQ